MQQTFDELYAKSKKKEKFNNLIDIILSPKNIMLAYRNIKSNTGSATAGTDGLTIKDIGKLPAEEVVKRIQYYVIGSPHGYRPKPVRRKDIPKPYDPTKTRPLGIPCIWDRLIQQCIKQVMEPICEAKFSEHSYGFRPNRSVENAIAQTYLRLQKSKMSYVIEFDIKGFFDNVNHSKLIKQIWAFGIQDKTLIYILKQILKAPIRMPTGETITPTKGTPQGGIISPLLANIVLNELDHWVESNWEKHPVTNHYIGQTGKNGMPIKSNAYRAMKTTHLKEMYIVRYADDFRIFCRNREDAEKTKIAITQWLSERLKLQVSEEKTRIVNVSHQYMKFLGFKIKLHPKGDKLTVISHIGNEQLKRIQTELTEQAKNIAKPRVGKTERDEAMLYNAKVSGIQNYYQIATHITPDLRRVQRYAMTILTNRLHTTKSRGGQLSRQGRQLTKAERARYGNSRQMRYIKGSETPIYPIGYVQTKHPMNHRASDNVYTKEGRDKIHSALSVNTKLLLGLMREPTYGNCIEYSDNRISLFSAQFGKCAVTGKEFANVQEIHCHHKLPKGKGGGDEYANLILVLDDVHKLIHATTQKTIEKYLIALALNKEQLNKLNELRKMVGNETVKP